MKKIISWIMLGVFLIGTLTLSFNVRLVHAQPTIYIYSDGSVSPSDGPIYSYDNITYTFFADVSYPNYNGIAVERNNIVIDGNGYAVQGFDNSTGVGLDLEGINNVTIKNVNVQNFQDGIYLAASSDNNTIRGNNVTANSNGITILSSNSNNITGNNASANGQYGIYLYSSSYNTVSGNNATANSYHGIYLDSSSNNNTVSGNNATANTDCGIVVDSSSYNTVIGNNVTANFYEGIYILSSSSYNTVIGNNVTANSIGIYLWGSSNNNTVNGNNASANSFAGIELTSSSNNIVSGNNAKANSVANIWLYSSSYNIVSGNNAAASSHSGIYVFDSSNNTIYHNDFINNTSQFYCFNSTNTWDNGYPSGGNFWSDYNGTDLYRGAYQNVTGSDGIGDTPYVIDASNTDNYPLMGPFGSAVNAGSNVTVFPSQDVGLIFSNVTGAGTVFLNKTLTVNAPALVNVTGEYYTIKTALNSSGEITVRIIFDGSNMTLQQKGNLTMVQYTPIPGDVVAPFGRVDMRDVAYVARHFGTNSTSPNWDPTADINGDGVVNMRDIALVARHFGFTANWVNITTYVDTINNVIYGTTTHFSFISIH